MIKKVASIPLFRGQEIFVRTKIHLAEQKCMQKYINGANIKTEGKNNRKTKIRKFPGGNRVLF